MFDWIQNFLVSVGEFFSKIWQFLVFVWEELTQFFKILAPAVNFFSSLIRSIHPVFLAFGLAILVVLIVYIIIGRTAGGD